MLFRFVELFQAFPFVCLPVRCLQAQNWKTKTPDKPWQMEPEARTWQTKKTTTQSPTAVARWSPEAWNWQTQKDDTFPYSWSLIFYYFLSFLLIFPIFLYFGTSQTAPLPDGSLIGFHELKADAFGMRVSLLRHTRCTVSRIAEVFAIKPPRKTIPCTKQSHASDRYQRYRPLRRV